MSTSVLRGSRLRRAAVFAGLLSQAACERRSLSSRLHEEAEHAERTGRIGDADRALERALRYDPSDFWARERAVKLRIERRQYRDAEQLLAARPAGTEQTVLLQNLGVRVQVGIGELEAAAASALALRTRSVLSPVAERELLHALRDAFELGNGLASAAAWPEPWVVQLISELIERGLWERAAALFLQRPDLLSLPERQSPSKRWAFERFQHHGWPIETEQLERLIPAIPSGPLEYLGRLEVLLRKEREGQAALLEPSRELLTDEWAPAWDLRWARVFAKRSDWYGVLSRTERTIDAPRAEAQRLALRSLAHFMNANPSAARVELKAWLEMAGPASFWGETLLLPELAPHAAILSRLRKAAVPL